VIRPRTELVQRGEFLGELKALLEVMGQVGT
jgi:hypothetical protein